MLTVWAVAVAGTSLCLIASDINFRRLPNSVVAVLGVLLIGYTMAVTIPDSLAGLVRAVGLGCFALLLALALYLRHLVGGGDVKLVVPITMFVSTLNVNGLLAYLGALIVAGALTLLAGKGLGQPDRNPQQQTPEQESAAYGYPVGPMLLAGVIAACVGFVF